MSTVFDLRQCSLGEGPLWHPLRQQLFWFDILGKKLLSRVGDDLLEWRFDEHVSAAGWLDQDRLLIASETGLHEFDLESQKQSLISALETENVVTRSNDGRADPYGGFWIGTMGKSAEAKAGAIYRYFRGELCRLFGEITISNAICFAPSGDLAYFADTPTQQIMKVSLDAVGWPNAAPEVFVDLTADNLNPDGAVVDADGNLWSAQWGAHRVAVYRPDGTLLKEIRFDAKQISCPAFGGADLSTLFATSAAVGLEGPAEGLTYCADLSNVKGQAEYQVIL